MLSAGMEVLAIDRETRTRWPEREVERPASFRDARLAALDDRQLIFSVEGAIAVQRDTVSAAARALLPLMAKELWFARSTLDSHFKCDTEFLSEGLDRRLEAEAFSRC